MLRRDLAKSECVGHRPILDDFAHFRIQQFAERKIHTRWHLKCCITSLILHISELETCHKTISQALYFSLCELSSFSCRICQDSFSPLLFKKELPAPLYGKLLNS